jgi:DNA-binding beta-propeller fold protein YncE
LVGALSGCGEDFEPGSASFATGSSAGADAGAGAFGGHGGLGAGGGGGGTAAELCALTANGPTRGSPIAATADGETVVVANRDYEGTVAVFGVDYGAAIPTLAPRVLLNSIQPGGETVQVSMDACGQTAYVLQREFKKVTEIVDLQGTPHKGRSVPVGSEPTGMALSPNNRLLFVANWVDGTVTVIDVAEMLVTRVIDLNDVLVGTGLLGAHARSRPALAHPRSVAITNDGDGDDGDEAVYVTEFFSQRIDDQGTNGEKADTNRVGLVYRIDLATTSASEQDFVRAIQLLPVPTGFESFMLDSAGNAVLEPTSCYPNQLQSITIHDGHAYVTSICASPRGPTGIITAPVQPEPPCDDDSDCAAPYDECLVTDPSGNEPPTCVSVHNVKTLTYPVVHAIDIESDALVTQDAVSLNEAFEDHYIMMDVPDDDRRRYPLVANEMAFEAGSNVAWIAANGADAVFRIDFDGRGGAAVGGPGDSSFVDLGLYPNGEDFLKGGRTPIGLALVEASGRRVGFVANDATRNVSVVDLETATAGAPTPSAVVDAADPTQPLEQLRGRHEFNTGLGRWSFRGQAWVACQVCHFEGFTDNVTWYFKRGPRQSTSLDASFGPQPGMQRIFNWTAVFDEMADFEKIARDLAGALGPHDGANNGLTGASATSTTLYEVEDLARMQAWIEGSVRSPDRPTTLPAEQVDRGKQLFGERGCAGCHGGPNWTLSERFYEPGALMMNALAIRPWPTDPSLLPPEAVLPVLDVDQPRTMRAWGPAILPDSKFDQILCVLREVGTYGISAPDINVQEVRHDMAVAAQGNQPWGRGYNVPSLFGQQAGAPYFHAGNARTLEELFDDELFSKHHRALLPSAAECPDPADPQNLACPLAQDDVDALVAFILSIDEHAEPFALPPAGPLGGDFCSAPPPAEL